MSSLLEKTDELKLKLMLTLARDRQAMQGRVRSVGYMREYLQLPDNLGAQTLSHMGEDELHTLALSVNIKPKSDAAHFHCYLNDVRYRLAKREQDSVKLVQYLPLASWLALMEHTGVSAKQELCERIGFQSTASVGRTALAGLQQYDQEQLKLLIHYCLCIGTENGVALHQAEGLFIFEDPSNMNSWTLMTAEEAVAYTLEHGYMDVIYIDAQAVAALYMK